MEKEITKCVCGHPACNSEEYPCTLEMDCETVNGVGRGIRIIDGPDNATFVIPESLALVIEKWMEENKGE
jgi:hypothetical protein